MPTSIGGADPIHDLPEALIVRGTVFEQLLPCLPTGRAVAAQLGQHQHAELRPGVGEHMAGGQLPQQSAGAVPRLHTVLYTRRISGPPR